MSPIRSIDLFMTKNLTEMRLLCFFVISEYV